MEQFLSLTSPPAPSKILGAGGSFHYYITKEGKCYVIGNNSYHQLGLKGSTFYGEWTLLPFNVKEIVSGFHHSLLLTPSGQVYATGENEFGQLGLGMIRHFSIWTLVPLEEPVRKIYASGDQSFLITEKGKAYATGSNRYGQLGSVDLPELTEWTLLPFTVSEFSCSPYYTLLCTTSGQWFYSGLHEGAFGLANSIKKWTRLPLPY